MAEGAGQRDVHQHKPEYRVAQNFCGFSSDPQKLGLVLAQFQVKLLC